VVDSAVVLFAHGARDPEWARPFERIRALVSQVLPETQVELAFLERMAPSLQLAISRVVASGAQHATVVPLFLASGGHIKEDLAAMITQLQRSYPTLRLDVTPPIGENDELVAAIAAWVVRAHAQNR
jgi:sirohydrochlorin cobaltochelatase